MPEVRLIDANALYEKVDESQAHNNHRGIAYSVHSAEHAHFKYMIHQAPTIEAEPVVHCKDCVYYHKPHVQRNDGTECDISEVPDEYKPFPLTNMCNSDYGINVGGKCEYDNNYAPYEDDKTVFRQPEDFCSRGRRKE